jgi:hypothetical protein
MAGTIVADTLTHSTAGSLTTDYVVNGSAKGWIYGTYSGGAPSDGNSLNVSSLTDNGVGRLQINLSNSFGGVDYAVNANSRQSTNVDASQNILTNSASQAEPRFYESGTTATDPSHFYCVMHGDLA